MGAPRTAPPPRRPPLKPRSAPLQAEYEMRSRMLGSDEVTFHETRVAPPPPPPPQCAEPPRRRHEKLGRHCHEYQCFVAALKADPEALASCIHRFYAQLEEEHGAAARRRRRRDATLTRGRAVHTIDDVLRCVIFGLHGNFFFPEEEEAIAVILERSAPPPGRRSRSGRSTPRPSLATLHIDAIAARGEAARHLLFLRENSAFSRFFVLYCTQSCAFPRATAPPGAPEPNPPVQRSRRGRTCAPR